jgi:hypothetical protein
MHYKFAVLALLSLVALEQTEGALPRLALAWCVLCFVWLGLAYAGLGPGLLLKRSDGRLTWLSRVPLAPYHLLNSFTLWLCRFTREPLYDQIAPGLYLGRRLTASQASALKVGAVLDLTAEFGECPLFLTPSTRYKLLPVLDTQALKVHQLAEAAEFIRAHLAGSVYVHCALGHGRSASAVAAYLLSQGKVSVEEALELIGQHRPGIGVSPAQLASLVEYRAGIADP